MAAMASVAARRAGVVLLGGDDGDDIAWPRAVSLPTAATTTTTLQAEALAWRDVGAALAESAPEDAAPAERAYVATQLAKAAQADAWPALAAFIATGRRGGRSEPAATLRAAAEPDAAAIVAGPHVAAWARTFAA